MCHTHSLSVLLQTKTLDLSLATNKVKELRTTLGKKRSDAQSEFKHIFEKASNIMEILDIKITKPITVKKQKYRDNFDVSDNNICTYWRRSIYVPLLDEIINDFDVRFSGENMKCFNLNFLMPSNLTQIINNSDQLNNAIEIISNQYSSLLNTSSFIISNKLEGEFKLIENVLLSPQFKDMNSACETLNHFDPNYYPMYTTFLKILITLPIPVATA